MRVSTIALAALSTVAPAAAAGTATIVNHCKFNVYLSSVCSDTTDFTPHVIHPGKHYSETYRTPTSGGVSIKLSSRNSMADPITQFEYTLAGGSIWYDLSNVNCGGTDCPFEKYGMYLESGDDCPTRSCAGGEPICDGIYNEPDDNINSLSCVPDADTTVYLCASSPPSEKKRSLQETGAHIHHRRRISHPHSRHYRSL